MTRQTDGWCYRDPKAPGKKKWRAGFKKPDGSKKQKMFEFKHEGDTWKNEEIAKLADPASAPSVEAQTTTLGEWINDDRAYSSPSVRAENQPRLRLWIAGIDREVRPVKPHRLSRLALADIRPQHLRDLVDEIEGKATPATAATVIRYLKAALGRAVEREWLQKNPAAKITSTWEERPAEVRPLTEEDLEALAAAVDERYRALILLLGWGGLRIGEASALRVGDISTDYRMVVVNKANKERNGQLELDQETKGKNVRTVPIAAISEELRAHVVRFSDPLDPDAHVFRGTHGALIRPNNFLPQIVFPVAKRLRLTRKIRKPDRSNPGRTKLVETFRVHWLRHTAASLAARHGIDVVFLQGMLGHEDPQTTFIYLHTYDADIDRYGEMMRQARMTARGDQENVVAIR